MGFDPSITQPVKTKKTYGRADDMLLNLAKDREEANKLYNDSKGYLEDKYSPEGYGTNYLPDKRPSGYKKYTHGNFTPAQMQLYNQAFQHVSPDSYLSKLAMGDESQFAEMEAPALRQFNQLQGNLASRFSGQGMGARGSSGFQNASNAAAQDFASQLQSNRQNLQRQAIMDLMGMTSSLLSAQPYSQGYAAKGAKGGIAGGYGQPVGTAVGTAVGAYYGQPAAGGAAGGAFGSIFD